MTTGSGSEETAVDAQPPLPLVLCGEGGNNHLGGGQGRNPDIGSDGNDVLNAPNGVRERIDCGAGNALMRGNRGGRGRDCERVFRLTFSRRLTDSFDCPRTGGGRCVCGASARLARSREIAASAIAENGALLARVPRRVRSARADPVAAP